MITSCFPWKRGFVLDNECSNSQSEKSFAINDTFKLNPIDFFFLKQVEYFYIYEDKTDTNNLSFSNEASVVLYKSVPADYEVNLDENVVEEKYLYLNNFSDTDTSVKGGEVLYFRTATYWAYAKDEYKKNKLGKEQLHHYFTQPKQIDLCTSKRLHLGYWVREKSNIQLLLNDGSNSYRVEAKEYADSLVFMKISQPRKDLSSKNINQELLIPLNNVMNLSNPEGLTFFRNVNSDTLAAERDIVVSIDGVPPKKVNGLILKYNYDKRDSLKIVTGECMLQCSAQNFIERDGYHRHKTRVLTKKSQSIFNEQSLVPRKELIKEISKRHSQNDLNK
jgi:hypothetical protein